MRRFLHRFEEGEDWQVYGMQVVAFGDMPAALALELAKELRAELGSAVDPMAAAQLLKTVMWTMWEEGVRRRTCRE